MAYNLKIPGQMSELELMAVEQIASCVPECGKVVEIGSLFGRSSWAWAKSVPPSAKVFCIDPWEGNSGVRPIEIAHGIQYGIDQFRVYTSDCPNIVPLKGFSPNDFQDWRDDIDVFFDDAVHQDPIFSENLAFWERRVRPDGIICGHDFRDKFPDIKRAVYQMAEESSRSLIVVENIWCLLPKREDAAFIKAKQILQDLSREWRRVIENHSREFSVSSQTMVRKSGQKTDINGKVRSMAPGGLPLNNDTQTPVRVGAKVYATTSPGRPLHELRCPLPGKIIGSDFVAFSLIVPELPPGSYCVEIDLVRENVCWFWDCGQDPVIVAMSVES